MKQLLLTAYGLPSDALQFVETASPIPKSGEALVRMQFASISPSDTYLIQGFYGLHPETPFAMGLEGVGIVTAVAENGNTQLVDRRVVILPNYEQGTWAEEVAVLESSLIVVDDTTDAQQLAMATVNPATAWGLLNRYGNVGPGDWVGQTAGNSAVGQYVITLAKRLGAKTLNVVRTTAAAEHVLSSGGDVALIDTDSLDEQLAATLGTETLALVIDGVGGETIGKLAHHLAPHGSAVNYAILGGEEPHVSVADLIYSAVALTGYWLVLWIKETPAEEVRRVVSSLVDLVEDGTLSANVEKTYPLSEFKAALAHATSEHKNGKILFAMNA